MTSLLEGAKKLVTRGTEIGVRIEGPAAATEAARGRLDETLVDEAQTIVENCGNTLILRCSASETGGTARFASKLIGDREVIRTHVSRSRSGGFLQDPRHSKSISQQHVTEPAVLGSEIEQLPDLTGYLKMASRPDWLSVKLRR